MASRALSRLPHGPNYRHEAFLQGLSAAGYRTCEFSDPRRDDVLLVWNRTVRDADAIRMFEAVGATIVAIENGYLGKVWVDRKWFAIARTHHNGAGEWRDGGSTRWDSWGVELAPWQTGWQVLILGQRGIGEPGLASPPGWAERVQRQIGGRIRPHPGKDKPRISLEDDLRNARCVVTWASGAALSALALGTPVYFDCPSWIGAQAAKPLASLLAGEAPLMDDAARLAMFRRLAYAMWTLEEVADGTALRWLLEPA